MKIDRQIVKKNKEDFKTRGRLLTDIERAISAFKRLYGYEMAWGLNSMYDGPSFSTWEGSESTGCLCTINKKNITVQDSEESDMMYSLLIGNLSTNQLFRLTTIVAQALSNPPAPYTGDIVSYVECAKESGIGLKIVGSMPLDVLARQTK